jgi:hypothetical protein
VVLSSGGRTEQKAHKGLPFRPPKFFLGKLKDHVVGIGEGSDGPPILEHDPVMGTNERRLDRIEQRARDAIADKAVRKAKRVVGIWNARQLKQSVVMAHTHTIVEIGGLNVEKLLFNRIAPLDY